MERRAVADPVGQVVDGDKERAGGADPAERPRPAKVVDAATAEKCAFGRSRSSVSDARPRSLQERDKRLPKGQNQMHFAKRGRSGMANNLTRCSEDREDDLAAGFDL